MPSEKKPTADLFPYDELSSGEASALLKHAQKITGVPLAPEGANSDAVSVAKAQANIRQELRERAFAMAKKDGSKPSTKPPAKPAGDTFVLRKIKEAEKNLPDFDLDEPETET